MVMVDLTAAEALDLSDWQRELIACDVSICEESLREYIKMAWPILEPATPFIPNWHIDCICDHLAAISAGQIKRLVINVPPGSSKALDSDTPVLTTWGWKRHGDLFRGDFVYGPDGTPKRVLGCTEERLEDSYAVKFDDGAEIIAGAEHLWAVERDEMVRLPKFKRSRVSRVVDTPDLRVSGYKRRKDEQRPDRIAICDPVQWPSRRFLIDPYVLGAWLGDGATISGALYSAEEDIRHFETLGEIRYVSPAGGTRTQNFYRINIPGLQTKLRVLGLLGNKHIPDDYLESSVEQRWALLQGLMDTDGHCSKSGVCQFTTRLPQLATQVHQLASSLGLKVHSRSRYTFLNGKRYGPHHHLSFVPRKGDLVFRLARKQLKINGNLNPRSRYRYVSSVTPVGKRVVKCIQVEGSIYLAGRAFVPTHNSLLTCALWPTWHWTQWPADRFMTASYTDVLSIRDALKSRRLIQSRWYQERWGHMFQLTGDQAAKCLVSGTSILMQDGSVKAIEQLKKNEKILTVDPSTEQHIQDSVVRVWNSGKQKVRQVTLSDGTVIMATPNHRLYGWDGWHYVEHLRVGDPLAVLRNLPPQSNGVTKDEAFLLALWLAEGTKCACSYEVATMDEQIIARMGAIGKARDWTLRSVGIRHTLTKEKQQTGITPMDLLKRFLGVRRTYGTRSRLVKLKCNEIRVPAEIFSASDDVVSEFLGTYIASDGCVQMAHGKNKGIKITSVSEMLIRDLALLLKRFGVKSTVRSQGTTKLDAWSVNITAKEDVLKLSHLPLFRKAEKLSALVDVCRSRTRHQGGRCATIPPVWKTSIQSTRHRSGWASRHTVMAVANKQGIAWLQEKMNGDLDWRRIVKIEELEPQETWHIETERTSTFVANGIYSHNSRYENDKTGYRIATHVGGATGERAKIRILDDPHNIEDVESDVIRESTINWVRTTWAEREADAKTGGDVVVMQRLHDRDVSGVLLHEIGGYEHICIPMRFEPKRRFVTVVKQANGQPWTDPRTVEGQLLCPARWDDEDVTLKEKRLGAYSASGQLQQRPSPEHGGILKRHWFRYWQHPGDALPSVMVKFPDGTHHEVKPVDLPYVFDRMIQSWDMTFKGTVGTDYVVGQQYGIKGPDTFLIDQSRAHRDFPETVAEVRTFTLKHKRYQGKILIEDKANGPAIISTLKREIPGIVPHPGNDDKIARAHANAHVVQSGNFFVPHPQIAPWVEEFLEECSSYPNGAYDDQVVSWSQAMSDLYAIEDKGHPITPQYSAKFHQSSKGLEPVPGWPCFRFWYQGVYPCCIVGQIHRDATIILVDCVIGEQSSTVEQLIDRKVLPLLASDYRGCTEWRDVTNHGLLSAKSDPTEHHLDHIISAKLDGSAEPGEPDFFVRLNAIVGLLSQTGRLVVNSAPTPGEAKPWIHEALNGGYAYRKDANGVISKSEPRKFHPLTSVGEALGHGLARVFQRKPLPPRKFDRHEAQKRAKQYAV